MNPQVLLSVVVVIIVLFSILGVLATGYLWVLFRKDIQHHRTLVPPARPGYLTFTMALASTFITIPGLWIAWLSLRRIVGLGPVPDDQVWIAGIATALIMSVPLLLAGRMVYLRYRTQSPSQHTIGDKKIIRTKAPSEITISPDGSEEKK